MLLSRSKHIRNHLSCICFLFFFSFTGYFRSDRNLHNNVRAMYQDTVFVL